ncbi:MAG TPA: glycosyltransferase family 9 protein [Pirellulales bacterium]|nr:glycosyltransferase family 9 protein [Pirellulales bacterium]
MPLINTTLGSSYAGIGDVVSLAWIAEGTRDTPDPISFVTSPANAVVLKLFGQNATDQPSTDGIYVGDAYATELAEGGARLRLDYIRDKLGLNTPYKRPRADFPPEVQEWAEQTRRGFPEDDLVLLFPQTFWKPRAWPDPYWVELAWWLKKRNLAVLAMLSHEDPRFNNLPNFMWGFDLHRVAALMSLASLVVGNDSGPAHISGTLGVPTIVPSGPTRADCVFGHIPEVIALTNDEPPDCAGCHFKPPFRAACDQGCQALYALKPHTVLGRVISELALISVRRPSAPAWLATE